MYVVCFPSDTNMSGFTDTLDDYGVPYVVRGYKVILQADGLDELIVEWGGWVDYDDEGGELGPDNSGAVPVGDGPPMSPDVAYGEFTRGSRLRIAPRYVQAAERRGSGPSARSRG